MASNNHISRLSLFGNILQHFPEFLIHLLPYIADRIVFNSIASCNRDTHEKSKVIVPPWPKEYQLPASDVYSIAVWSPDGTRIAYTCYRPEGIIAIVDQRHGIIHRINNNNHGVDFWDLKFAPNGRFLVSASSDNGIVNLWNNDIVGNYEQLQEWNISEDVGKGWLRIDSSTCSKYIVVASYSRNRVVLIRNENGETIRSLTPQPVMMYINEVIFSVDCHVVFICGMCKNSNVIKLWRPYLEDSDENRLITLWEQENHQSYDIKIIVSHNKMMIAIQDTADNKGWLLSLDNNYNCAVQKLNVPGSNKPVLLQFTPDDECIIYTTNNGLKYWSVGEKKFTDKESVFDNKRAMNSLKVVNCSPNNRQLIVQDDIEEEDSPLYIIKSIFKNRKV